MLVRDRVTWFHRDGENWGDYVRRRSAPRPSVWRPFERSNWHKAIAAAERRGSAINALPGFVFPLWIALNEDEVPRDDEWKLQLVVWSGGEVPLEVHLEAGPAFWARTQLTVTRGSFVASGQSYVPGYPNDLYGSYGVFADAVAGLQLDVLEACEVLPARPAPTSEVPGFSQVAESAFEPDRLPKDVAAAMSAAVSWLTYVNEDEDAETGDSGDSDISARDSAER